MQPDTCPNEIALLLACARTQMDSHNEARIQALAQSRLDWSLVLEAATQHGVTPLLHRHLSTVAPGIVPTSVFAALQQLNLHNARRNLYRTQELRNILQLLDAGGIAAVPFKGPTLAAMAYDNLSLRKFGDLDILVHPENAVRSWELLVSQGYRAERRLNTAQESALVRYDCERLFDRESDGTVVEIHWRFAPKHFAFPLDMKRVWGRLERVSLGGVDVPSLHPDDLLLFLTMHGAKHAWERIGWVCDIGEVIAARPDINWQRLMEEAAAMGVQRMLLTGLSTAHALLGAALPEVVMQRLDGDRTVSDLTEQVKRWRFRLGAERHGNRERTTFYLRSRERLIDRARYVVARGMTPCWEDWEMLPLPSALFSLYYLLRPPLVAAKYGMRAWRNLRTANDGATVSDATP